MKNHRFYFKIKKNNDTFWVQNALYVVGTDNWYGKVCDTSVKHLYPMGTRLSFKDVDIVDISNATPFDTLALSSR